MAPPAASLYETTTLTNQHSYYTWSCFLGHKRALGYRTHLCVVVRAWISPRLIHRSATAAGPDPEGERRGCFRPLAHHLPSCLIWFRSKRTHATQKEKKKRKKRKSKGSQTHHQFVNSPYSTEPHTHSHVANSTSHLAPTTETLSALTPGREVCVTSVWPAGSGAGS